MSNSLYIPGFASKGIIGYTTVTEVISSTAENGRTAYTYFNGVHAVTSFPSIPSLGEPRNGQLLATKVYDAKGVLVKQTAYVYEEKEEYSLQAAKVLVAPAGTFEGALAFEMEFYNTFSVWEVLAAQTETSYRDGQAFTTTKTFAYDNAQHKEITREQVSTSAGDTRVTHRLYPADYANTTGFIGELKAAHITSAPIEQVTCRAAVDGTPQAVLAATLTTYSTGANVGLPDRQWLWETAAPVPLAAFKFTNQATAGSLPASGSPVDFTLTGKDSHYPDRPRLRLTYDAFGQTQQEQKTSGLYTTYLWSYAHSLPVAQIQNASAAQVQAALTKLGLRAEALPMDEATLRSTYGQLRQLLPQAHITGFTHRPLIGLTSQTDPTGRFVTYEYDDLSRLVRTRDEQGRILSQQQYHYAGAN